MSRISRIARARDIFTCLYVSLVSLFFCLPAQAGEPSTKPIIGINMELDGSKPVRYVLDSPYARAIAQAGAIPVLLPPMSARDLENVAGSLDGLLLTGGLDYPPSLYGQKESPKVVRMNEERSSFDMDLARYALAHKDLPVLGICAGCQALNIASGGTLIQDIPSAFKESKIKHASPNGWRDGFNRHYVEIKPDSKLRKIIGEKKVKVVTSHHQCVDKPGKGLKVGARSKDGVIEAVESDSDRFLIGVQWHPERDMETGKDLFKKFVNRCRAYKLAREKKAL
ncbi:MAG: gamma-glutamyl-gamma-aminobutyrate hydrolase family protein [Cyanobacteria bacterium HKST-UBA02]|nr:gamma-glutamyl-gamma-aminobutyrate hydrolase family protein [Cyanobacteria bacterium HKST-UBA02]